MGVDAVIRIRTKVALSVKEQVDLGYEIRSRFGDIIVPRRWNFEADNPNATDNPVLVAVEDDPLLYDVCCTCHYYGYGYERGPALFIFGLLYYLHLLNCVTEVQYGGDSSDALQVMSLTDIQALLQLYCAVGREPYTRGFDREHDGPECCGRQMIRNGFGPDYKAWFCGACSTHITEEKGVRTTELDK